MKVNILKFTLAAGLAAVSLTSVAQNLDPTVVVNRAYEGKLLEVHKPAIEMAVPDSVQRFDLDFDYSVFENPYKGSYEFKPYQLLLKPVSSGVEKSKFWLNAGAGYTLYPVVNMVWTPVQEGPFKMSVYGDYDGYFGSYRSFRPDKAVNGTIELGRWERDDKATAYWKGYRMRTVAGVDGRYDWDKSALSFNAGYYGTASKDTLKNRSFNAFDVNLRMAAKPRAKEYFHYDVKLDYRFGADNLEYRTNLDNLTEHDFSAGAVLGPVLSENSRVLFDVGFDAVAYAGQIESTVGQIIFAPHYLFVKDAWNLDLGVKVAKIFRMSESASFQSRDQVVYPDIKIRYAAIPDALAIYLHAGGGNTLNTYSSLLERNNFVDPTFGLNSPLLDATVERVALRLGFDGRISKRFSYDIHGGYVNYASGLLDAVGVVSGTYRPAYGYASYSKLFAGVDWSCHTESLNVDGTVEYTHVTGLDKTKGFFAPAALTGDVSVVYNWNKRVFAGVDCIFASKRKGGIDGQLAVIPGFADLGLTAEYAVSRKFAVWLRGGNLMNMTVQYSPLYAEKGINFTAGVRLKL